MLRLLHLLRFLRLLRLLHVTLVTRVTVVTLVTRVTDGVSEFLREEAMLRCYASFTSYGPRKIQEGSQVTVVTLVTRVTDGVSEFLREEAMLRCYASYAVTWAHIRHLTSHYWLSSVKLIRNSLAIQRIQSKEVQGNSVALGNPALKNKAIMLHWAIQW